eukprot:IDg22621t1
MLLRPKETFDVYFERQLNLRAEMLQVEYLLIRQEATTITRVAMDVLQSAVLLAKTPSRGASQTSPSSFRGMWCEFHQSFVNHTTPQCRDRQRALARQDAKYTRPVWPDSRGTPKSAPDCDTSVLSSEANEGKAEYPTSPRGGSGSPSAAAGSRIINVATRGRRDRVVPGRHIQLKRTRVIRATSASRRIATTNYGARDKKRDGFAGKTSAVTNIVGGADVQRQLVVRTRNYRCAQMRNSTTRLRGTAHAQVGCATRRRTSYNRHAP